ncbi:MAG: hypothetical protein KME63_10165 [Candidatus Thiodiazotropha sp. (ex Clathrolucina costata)]|nr:hypothetical protein [Candidatus Thiodiazotropha taylori]MBV2125577.1 hypothetical protein [Candidatus Thiodiazotropha taylori]
MNKPLVFLVPILWLFGCSNSSEEDTRAGPGTDEQKYSVCECVNEPIRSGKKAQACGKLAQTLPDYVTRVMACKGETVKDKQQ